MTIEISKKERVQVWVSPRLKDVLAAIQKEMAIKMKKEFNLQEITVNGTIASDCLAGRYLEDKIFKFKINRTGLNTGIIQLV
jgi:hypothetical protein